MKTINNILASLKSTLLVTVMLFTCVSVWGGTDISFDPATDKSFPKDGITISVSNGTLTNGTDYRVYKNATMTISSTVGNISNIALTYSEASYDGGGWASSYQPNSTSWTSPTASGEQARITKIVVTVGASTYTVTYNANGATSGSVPTDETKYESGASVTVLGNTGNLAKTNYKFGGWNTNEGGTGTNYQAGATFNISANTTLYAKWNTITYTDPITACAAQETASIAFSANGKTLKSESSLPETINDVPLNQPYSLSGVGSVEATGYTFVGWNNDKDATTKLDAFTPTEGKTYTMFAIWTTNQHKVTYVMDGGEGCDNIDAQAYGTVVDVCANPQKSGAVFKAWTSDDVVIENGQFTMPDKDVTITATWTPTHTAKFYNNEVEIPSTSVTVAEGAAITFPANPTPAKDTYTFQGWKTSKVSTTDTKPDGLVTEANMGNADVNYYAVFAIGTPGQLTSIFSDALNVSGTSELSSRNGWTSFDKVYANSGNDVRFSTGSAGGKMTKTAMNNLVGNAIISFKAKAYGSTENGKISLSVANGGTLGTPNSFTITNSTEYVDCSVSLTGATDKTTIKLTGTSNNRIYIKNFKIEVQGPTTYSGYTTLIRTLQSIAVSGAPTKTEYTYGDTFEPAGLTVTGTYNVGKPAVITEGITWPNLPNVTATSVDVTAQVGEITSPAFTVTGLTVNKKAGSITVANMSTHVGEQKTITPSATSHDANVTYSIQSGSENVSLDGNKVTGAAEGEATIRATLAANDEYAESYTDFTVTVESALITPTLTYNDVAIATLEQNTLTPTEKTSDGAITYTIKSGSEYITLADGVVTAKAVGSAVVTASQEATATYTAKQVDINITVSKATPTLSVENLTAYVGEADVAPVATTNNTDAYTITYSVDENDYISIIDNKVHAKANGQATVTATIAATDNFESNSTTFTATAETRPLYTVTFYYKGGNEAKTETAYQGGVTAPSVVAVGDYTFSGWAAEAVATETTTKPDYVALTESKYYPTEESAKNLYAVYTTTKDVEQKGMWISYTDEGTKQYLGAATFTKSSGEYNGYFATTETKGSATTLYLENNRLFWVDGTNKYYIQDINDSKMRRTSDAASATVWTITSGSSSTVFLDETYSRYLAYNDRFSTYTNNVSYPHDLTVEESSESVVVSKAHYFSNPSAAVTPTIEFSNPTTSVVCDATVKNVATSNKSDVTITYSSSDEDIATVDADGTVTGHKYGSATITATITPVEEKYFTNSASYTMEVQRITTTIKFNGFDTREASTQVYAGNTYNFPASTNAKQDDPDAPVIVYSLSSDNYATVNSETGQLTVKDASGTWSGTKSATMYAKVPNSNTRYTSCNNSSTYAKLTLTIKDNRKTQTIGVTTPAYNFVGGESVADFTNALTGTQAGTISYSVTAGPEGQVTVSDAGLVHVDTDIYGTSTITVTAAKKDVVEEGITFTYPEVSTSFTVSVSLQSPVFSPAACSFKAPMEVSLSAGQDVSIKYTDNGSTPTTSSTAYTSPIAVSETTTFKAIAVIDETTSPVVEATYTKITPEITCNVADGGNVPAGKGAITLSADADVLISYVLYNANSVEIASANDVKSPVSIDVTMGDYILSYQGKWDCDGGFSSDETMIYFTATGAGHLPISININKDDGAPAYFSRTDNVELYGLSDKYNPNCGVGLKAVDAAATIQFAEKPNQLTYYARLNGESKTGYELVVRESPNGSNYTVVKTHNPSQNSLSTNTEKVEGTMFTCDLAENTRFVQWLMTEKTTGTNIVFGNVTITAANDGDITIDGVNVTEIPAGFQGNVTIANGGTLEVYQSVSVNDLTVQQGGVIELADNINVSGDLIIQSAIGDLSTPAKSGQIDYMGDDANISVAGSVFIDIKLDPSGVASAGWYAFAVPFEVALNGGVYGKLQGKDWALLTNESDFAVMQYQGDVRAQGKYGWIKVHKTGATTLKPGVFYLVTVADTDFGTLRFKKAAGAALNNKAEITINEHAVTGSGVANKDNGWNGVANNGLTYADLTFGGDEEKVQVYYHTSNSFDALAIDDYTFVVASPFFVQSPAGGDVLAFDDASHSDLRAPSRTAAATGEFNVRLGKDTESYVDQLYLSATDDATATYQIGHDMVKSFMGDAPKVAQFYINGYDQKLCDAEFPLVNNEAEFPLTFTAPAAGEYQLYVNRVIPGASLYLYHQGNLVWNLSLGAYTIDLGKTANSEYSLVMKLDGHGIGTGAAEIDANQDGIQKFILDEQLYIIRNGQLYNAAGALVK